MDNRIIRVGKIVFSGLLAYACMAEHPEMVPERPSGSSPRLLVEAGYLWDGLATKSCTYFGPRGLVLEEEVPGTRAHFSGEDKDGNPIDDSSFSSGGEVFERIDWDSSDKIYLFRYGLRSDNYYTWANGEFKMNAPDGEILQSDGSALDWSGFASNSPCKIAGIYPSLPGKATYDPDEDILTVTGIEIDSTLAGYTVAKRPEGVFITPDSQKMYLYTGLPIKDLSKVTAPQKLAFRPMFNALQFLVDPLEISDTWKSGMTLRKVILYSDSAPLAGKNATVEVHDVSTASLARSSAPTTPGSKPKGRAETLVFSAPSGYQTGVQSTIELDVTAEDISFNTPLDITVLTYPCEYTDLKLELVFHDGSKTICASGVLATETNPILPVIKYRYSNMNSNGGRYTFEVKDVITFPAIRYGNDRQPLNDVRANAMFNFKSYQNGDANQTLDWTAEQWNEDTQVWMPINDQTLATNNALLPWLVYKDRFPYTKDVNAEVYVTAYRNYIARTWEGETGTLGTNAAPHNLSKHDIYGNKYGWGRLTPEETQSLQDSYLSYIQRLEDDGEDVSTYQTFSLENLATVRATLGEEGILPFDDPIETANAYVVSQPGTYSFYAAVGNSINSKRTVDGLNTTAYENLQGKLGTAYLDGSNAWIEDLQHLGESGRSFIDYSHYKATNGDMTVTGNRSTFRTLGSFPDYKDQSLVDNYAQNEPGRINIEPSSGHYAKLLWQDIPGLITDVRISDPVPDEVNGGLKYEEYPSIIFNVSQDKINQGNAVIALYDDTNTIVWSWHIWVMEKHKIPTHDIGSAKVLGMNLGQTQGLLIAQPERSLKIRFTQEVSGLRRIVTLKQLNGAPFDDCVYYQWGRKDPLLPSLGLYHIQEWGGSTAFYNIENFINIVYDANGAAVKIFDEKIPGTPYQYSIGDMIQHPTTTYTNSTSSYWRELYQIPFLNLWDSKALDVNEQSSPVKTIYDPCPPGFCVPNGDAFAGLSTRYKDYLLYSHRYDVAGNILQFIDFGGRGTTSYLRQMKIMLHTDTNRRSVSMQLCHRPNTFNPDHTRHVSIGESVGFKTDDLERALYPVRPIVNR